MYQPNDGFMGHTVTATTQAGYWIITSSLQWHLTSKPNFRTRLAARIFLGWTWIDNGDEYE